MSQRLQTDHANIANRGERVSGSTSGSTDPDTTLLASSKHSSQLLRTQVDQDQLDRDLQAVAAESKLPTSVSLWLRGWNAGNANRAPFRGARFNPQVVAP